MYYKIENKECEVYKKLYDLRKIELQMDKENLQAIQEKTGLDFEDFLGYVSQQSFRRVKEYIGFKFKEPEKVDLKIWKRDKKNTDVFIPNRRSKIGREIDKFLSNGLQYSNFNIIFEILKLERGSKFTFPYLEIVDNDILILFFGDNHQPQDENIIEITSKEFNELNK